MPLPTDSAPPSVAERWERVIGGASAAHGPVRLAPPRAGDPSSGAGTPTTARQLELAELFVRTDPDERRVLDLVCLVLVTASPAGVTDTGHGNRLVVLGPQALRAQGSPSVSGLTVLDVPLGPDLDASRVSVAVLRMHRRLRISQITNSIDELGRVLDYDRDPLGSDAVARAVLARVDVLANTSGVRIAVSGAVDLTAVQDVPDSYHLLLPGVPPDDVRTAGAPIRADRLPASIRGRDFVVLRRGRPRPRRARVRSLVELRREHALAEIGADLATVGADETYAVRVTQARQDARARAVMQAVSAGDTAAAVRAYRAGLEAPNAVQPLQEGLASRITTIADFWLVDDALAAAEGAGAVSRDIAALLRTGLDARLEQLLGLRQPPATEQFPVTTPIVTEFADDLVPHVDSRQDGGHFIELLIPRMRTQIKNDTGITIPGVRLRGGPTLPPGVFQVQVDELPVLTGTAPADVWYRVVPAAGAAPEADEQQVPLHPSTGDAGVWLVRPLRDDPAEPSTDDGHLVDLPQYLIQQIGLAIRSYLHVFLGPQELDGLLVDWSASGPDGLVRRVVPDGRARLRLTWVLQSLVVDGVPVDDGPAILAAVRDAGGLNAPLPVLRRAARAAMRERLPGRQDQVPRFPLPDDHESAVLEWAHGHPAAGGDWYSDLVGWLHQVVSAVGPVVSVVTRSQETREGVASIARPLHRFVRVLTVDELSP